MKYFNLPIEKEKVQRVKKTPPMSENLRLVGINGFGYARGDDRVPFTGGFSTCTGVFLRSSEADLRVLFHLTTHIDHLRCIIEALSHLANNHLLATPAFDDARLITTWLYGRTAAKRIYLALRMYGIEPRVMRYALPGATIYSFGRGGELTLADKVDLDTQDELRKMWDGTRIDAPTRRSVLTCENTGQVLSEPRFFEIYPGVPSLRIRADGSRRDGYSVHFPLADRVNVPVSLLGPDQYRHTFANVLNCSYGRYVQVTTAYHQSPTAIAEVNERVFSIAAEIYV